MSTPYFVPSPRTWTSGEIITAPALRADVSGTVMLLNQPPMMYAQQTKAGQSITNNTLQAVQLDTELYDNLNGHVISNVSQNPNYYSQLAGWYLVDTTVALVVGSSGNTTIQGTVSGVQNGSGPHDYGGDRIQASNSATQSATSSKLMELVVTGTIGGSGDYCYAAILQNQGTAQTLGNTIPSVPYMTVRWVCATSGTSGLPVPVNASWPVSPTDISTTFMTTNVQDTCEFLIYPPAVEAAYAGGSSLASSASIPTTGATVPLNSIVLDTYGAFNTGTNTWTAPVAGLYYLYGCVSINTDATSNSLACGFTVTSSNYFSGSTATIWGGVGLVPTNDSGAITARKRLRFNANDTVTLAAAQFDASSNAAAYHTAGAGSPSTCRMIIIWETA